MRVPTTGLTLEERRIVREAYQVAERMLAGYQEPPSLPFTILGWLAQLRVKVLARD
ncbi:MAG TPA: hypothetical protein VGN60_12175 [Devosia sp.]|jgi:hypothetical protein|nr:hypothetical protein [Devosia sp.]